MSIKTHAAAIKRWVKNRVEAGEVNKVRFCISPANVSTPIHEDPLMKEVREWFREIGVEAEVVDTVRGAANLNRDWLETGEVEAIIEYSGVYPIHMDPEKAAWLAELDNEGRVRMTVFVERNGELVPNA